MTVPPRVSARRKAIRRAGLILTFWSTCALGTVPPAGDGGGSAPGGASHGDAATFHLDFRNPSAGQSVEAQEAGLPGSRFVQVRVIEVVNPAKHPLQFEVRYLSKDGHDALLGSFSLYPSDNPGTFIVPTLGKVRADGTLQLTMTTTDPVGADDATRVQVRRMKLVTG